MESASTVLNKVFGYASFRFPQLEAISTIHQGNDTLVIMPTGGGKSLCYQIPALQLKGLTIVISPLISLMQDQITGLKTLGVPAVSLNSSLSSDHYHENTRRILNGEAKLLYLAPESIVKPYVFDLIKQSAPSLLAVDEAHCISAWGHNFRPEYRLIAHFRKAFPYVPCIALTASATPEVKEDIQESLFFKNGKVFNASFFRENIHIKVYQKQKDGSQQVLELIQLHKEDAGLVYCYSRKSVDSLVNFLFSQGINARGYHAGISPEERAECQDEFIKDNIQVVVATVAFGMGIDKSNIRFVIHKDLPKSMEGYYQEIGRSGRDGEMAKTYLLYTPGDAQKIMYFVEQNESKEIKAIERKKLNDMLMYAESSMCRWENIIAYFGEKLKEKCGQCDSCSEPQVKDINMSTLVQKIISAIYRTHSRFSTSHIIGILLGETSEKSKRHRHHELPTWGVGKDLKRQEWNYYIRQMINDNLLWIDYENYMIIKPTTKGLDIFRDRSDYFGYSYKVKKQVNKIKRIKEKEKGTLNVDLFHALKKLRRELAIANNFPPYIIFSDKTLREMSELTPTTLIELLQVSGVGQYKAKKYGEKFIQTIRKFSSKTKMKNNI